MKSKILRRYKSRSGGDWHSVIRCVDGSFACTCKGWAYNHKCWHMLQYIDQELDAFGTWIDKEIAKANARAKRRRK